MRQVVRERVQYEGAHKGQEPQATVSLATNQPYLAASLTFFFPLKSVRQLQDEPHSQRIAEAAVGIGAPDNGKRGDDNVECRTERIFLGRHEMRAVHIAHGISSSVWNLESVTNEHEYPQKH
jgi:hypothetical protein